MSNKEQLIEILTQRYKRYDGIYRRNAFDSEPRYQYYSFNEISTLDDADIDKIIQVYQSKTSEPMSMNNRLLLLDCVYETIADNKRYQELFDKLIDIYKIELDDKLTKTTTRYDDFNLVETSELHQAPYTTLPEYSLILSDMCTRYINEAKKSYTENSILPPNNVESRISTYEAIKSDFAKVNQQMPEVQEQIVSQAKVMVNRANEERNANIEKERQQKEIELINLQQEIIKMENERLEIEKRIRTISRETLGSYYSKQVSEKYPEEYQKFQQHEDQVKNYFRNETSISDIKEKFNKVSEDLKFYKGILPVYEKYYQRFEEVKKEYQQQRIDKIQERKSKNTSSSIPFKSSVEQQNEAFVSQVHKPQQNSFVENLTNEVKERIVQYIEKMDTRVDIKVVGIDNVYQEGKYIVVEAKQDNGRFIGAQFTPEDFSRLFIFVKQPSELNQNESSQSINKTSELRANNNENVQNNNSNLQIEEKNKLINELVNAMINAGEFHSSALDINKKMKDIEYAKKKLESKSIEELELALSVYAPQQEESNSIGRMHM